MDQIKPLVPGDLFVASLENARKFVNDRGITLDKPFPETAPLGSRCFIKIGENSTGILTMHHNTRTIDIIQAAGRVYRTSDTTP